MSWCCWLKESKVQHKNWDIFMFHIKQEQQIPFIIKKDCWTFGFVFKCLLMLNTWQLLTITCYIFIMRRLLFAISLFIVQTAKTCGQISCFTKHGHFWSLTSISLIVSELQQPQGLDLSPAVSTVKCYVSSWHGLYKTGAPRPHTARGDPATRVNKLEPRPSLTPCVDVCNADW